jgi:tetratricopeptide (TPR) repeat protein
MLVCPICGSVREFDDVEIGEQVKCQCGEVFVVERSASSVDTAAEVGIVKCIRNELFSNPLKGFYGYFKRLWSYTQLTIMQIRNPIFSLDQEPHVVERQKGLFFPILFRFLNPFGTTGQEKIRKLDKGYIAYSKESVSLLVFTVFVQFVLYELTEEYTPPTLMVAFMNGLVLVSYFLLIVSFAIVGRYMTRQITDAALSRKIQEAYVYEATMCFGLVVFVMNVQILRIVGGQEDMFVFETFLWACIVLSLLAALHPFYFLVSINRRFKIWTRVSGIIWGCALFLIAGHAIGYLFLFSTMAAGTQLADANRGTVYYTQAELDKAIVDYNKAISLDLANTIVEYNNRGLGYYQQGELDKAITEYTKAIELDPQYALAYANRGLAYYQQGELDKAITEYTKAIELDPANAITYTNRGLAYYQQGELDKAVVDYNKAIELDLQYALAYNNRGLAYYQQGELDKAITEYTKAIELDPANAITYTNRGLAYYQQGELDKAVTDYTKAIELDPQYALAYANRGLAYKDQGELDKAIVDYNKAIELDPADAIAYYNRGKSYQQQGESDKAIVDFSKAIELNPQMALAYNSRGIAYYNQGDLDKAIAGFTKAIELNPQMALAYSNRGFMFEKLGDKESAEADYAKAKELGLEPE